MKILFIGDIHGYFSTLKKEFLDVFGYDIVIQCGDFGIWPQDYCHKLAQEVFKNNKKLIYFCDGNHEDHMFLKNQIDKYGSKNPIEIYNNVFYMPRGSVLELNNKKFLFMGGANSIDKHLRKENYDWFREETISQKDFNNLPYELDKVDFVISHTVPECILNSVLKFPGYEKDPSRIALDNILEMFKPDRWYAGHFHHFVELEHLNCKFTILSDINDLNVKASESLEI